MDAKLQEFVNQVQTLADIRNGDPMNPVAFDMDVPGLSMRYRVVGSISEPTFQAYPINVLWVVLDANSPYYRRVLQLRSHDTAEIDSFPDAVQYGFLGVWVEIQTYDDLFLLPQYYVYSTGGGQSGPPGPKGDPGYNVRGQWSPDEDYSTNDTVFHQGSSYVSKVDGNRTHEPGGSNWQQYWDMVAQKGDSPEIDYDYIINQVIARLSPVPVSISISGLPATIVEGSTATVSVAARYSDNSTQVVTAECTFSVVTADGGTIDKNGTYTAPQVNADMQVTIRAVWVKDGKTFTAEKTTTVRNVEVVPKARYGVGPAVTDMANYTSDFVNNVTNTEVDTAGPTVTFSITTGSGQYGYYAHPKSWGVLRFVDTSNNFEGGWDGAQNNIMDPRKWGPIEVQATVNGVTEAWYVYRMDMPSQGNTRWNVSP